MINITRIVRSTNGARRDRTSLSRSQQTRRICLTLTFPMLRYPVEARHRVNFFVTPACNCPHTHAAHVMRAARASWRAAARGRE